MSRRAADAALPDPPFRLPRHAVAAQAVPQPGSGGGRPARDGPGHRRRGLRAAATTVRAARLGGHPRDGPCAAVRLRHPDRAFPAQRHALRFPRHDRRRGDDVAARSASVALRPGRAAARRRDAGPVPGHPVAGRVPCLPAHQVRRGGGRSQVPLSCAWPSRSRWPGTPHGSTARMACSSSPRATGPFFTPAVTTFADCAKIKPPADEQRLCLNTPVSERNFSQVYVWASDSPIHAVPGGEFGKLANKLGTDFALRAVQGAAAGLPAGGVASFWEEFPAEPPQHAYRYRPGQRGCARSSGTTGSPRRPERRRRTYAARYFDAYDPAGLVCGSTAPYAGWMRGYQRFFVVSGPLLGLITLTGLAGLVAAWRRIGGPALLPWLTGLVLLVTPAAVANSIPATSSARSRRCALPPPSASSRSSASGDTCAGPSVAALCRGRPRAGAARRTAGSA